PDPKYISTSFAEWQNLNMRMHMRRFTRLTNAFSKKIENHAHNVALFVFYYNYVRIHKTLRMTPAMAAGVTDKLWEASDLVAVLEAWEASNCPTPVGISPSRRANCPACAGSACVVTAGRPLACGGGVFRTISIM